MMEKENRSHHHFVLVHGACLGGWCWYKLVALLRAAGHRATTVDLGASGVNLKQPRDLSTISDYFEPLMSMVSGLPPEEKVVVVGHSMGGVATAVAMEKFPEKILAGVFLSAYMPGPNLTAHQITQAFNLTPACHMDTVYTCANGKENCPTTFLFGPKFLAHKIYQLSPPEDLVLGNLLARPFPSFHDEESAKACTLTEKNYGSVPRVYVVCENDNGMTKDRQFWQIRSNPPDQVMEISGSDHMPMCSKPTELCSCLLSIASKYNT